MPDGIKLSSLWHFRVDVSFKLVILSCEAIFFLIVNISVQTLLHRRLFFRQRGAESACWGSAHTKNSWRLKNIISNTALMLYRNSGKDAYIALLIFLETNLQHTISSCVSEILSEMQKQEKRTR